MGPGWAGTFAAIDQRRTMDTLFRTLLFLHVAAGFIALLRGNKIHIRLRCH